jgi:hypothetical protein
VNRRQAIAEPMHEMSRELIRKRLAQFLPQSERPADTQEAKPEDAFADDDMALLESTFAK